MLRWGDLVSSQAFASVTGNLVCSFLSCKWPRRRLSSLHLGRDLHRKSQELRALCMSSGQHKSARRKWIMKLPLEMIMIIFKLSTYNFRIEGCIRSLFTIEENVIFALHSCFQRIGNFSSILLSFLSERAGIESKKYLLEDIIRVECMTASLTVASAGSLWRSKASKLNLRDLLP